MLEMDPFARYPTYESLLKDMTNALTPLVEARSGKKPEKKKSVAVPVIGGLVALALIGGLTYLGMHLFQASTRPKSRCRPSAPPTSPPAASARSCAADSSSGSAWIRDPGRRPGSEAPAAPVNEWTLPASDDTTSPATMPPPTSRNSPPCCSAPARKTPLEEASKIYLRFSLAGVDKKRLDQASSN
jgi:hypothetical protein